MGLNPRRTGLDPNSLKQWICREWVGKIGWNELDQKIKCQEHEDRLIFLEKIVLSTIRWDEFLYISHKFDYRVSSWLLQCSLVVFLILFSPCVFSFLYSPFSSPLPFMCLPDGWCWYLSHQPLCVITIRLITTVQTSPAARELATEQLMWW